MEADLARAAPARRTEFRLRLGGGLGGAIRTSFMLFLLEVVLEVEVEVGWGLGLGGWEGLESSGILKSDIFTPNSFPQRFM